jgi:hypothetical protein
MAIRKHKFSKKSKKYSKSKKMLSRKKTKRSNKSKKYQRGGFSSNCNLATVKESGFSLDALGSIAGLSIPSSRGAIYRPNCKTDTYQAMTP